MGRGDFPLRYKLEEQRKAMEQSVAEIQDQIQPLWEQGKNVIQLHMVMFLHQ